MSILRNIEDQISECFCKKTLLWGDEDGVLISGETAQNLLNAVYALQEIKKGEGAYSKDPLTHANNTIKNLVNIASKALGVFETETPLNEEKNEPLPKTKEKRRCNWCNKRKSITKGYNLGEWFICYKCNSKHDVV